ncbi:YtzI protein [Ectobacillus ponti]|uniref:YtzI protein n=1 Tax=Ectobacillus ponti TaxID=2961894 RepID=A0AA41X5J1_9BACI|nr:YtzI protein [Ectobacillus ponti]MCP8967578.1 YtzI protein [Ectobacillus ponti]
MFKVLVISVVVVIIVLLLSVLTIGKGYSYKHTVDRAEDSPVMKGNSTKKPHK